MTLRIVPTLATSLLLACLVIPLPAASTAFGSPSLDDESTDTAKTKLSTAQQQQAALKKQIKAIEQERAKLQALLKKNDLSINDLRKKIESTERQLKKKPQKSPKVDKKSRD